MLFSPFDVTRRYRQIPLIIPSVNFDWLTRKCLIVHAYEHICQVSCLYPEVQDSCHFQLHYREISGLHEHCTTPMGVADSSATFQGRVQSIANRLNCVCCLVLLDDIVFVNIFQDYADRSLDIFLTCFEVTAHKMSSVM